MSALRWKNSKDGTSDGGAPVAVISGTSDDGAPFAGIEAMLSLISGAVADAGADCCR